MNALILEKIYMALYLVTFGYKGKDIKWKDNWDSSIRIYLN